MPLRDLLGIGSADLAKATELYRFEIPACVKIPDLESCPNGFDFCGYFLQCVADDFYRRHGLQVKICGEFLCSIFDSSDEEYEQIQSLADKGDEIAEFILRRSITRY